MLNGELGWRSGESARHPPMCPGFDSRTRRHMWVEFVVGSRSSSEGFSPGSPVFLPPQKSTFLNSNSIGNSRATGLSVEDCYVLPSLNKVNLFILFILFIYLKVFLKRTLNGGVNQPTFLHYCLLQGVKRLREITRPLSAICNVLLF